MRLTKTTSHAIRILIDCAQAAGGLVKVAEIAQRLDITPLNVFKVVHLLSRAGFVEAVRGRNGGVRLARPAETIRIGEIVRAMEATQVEVAAAAIDAKPRINTIFDDALDAFISVLDRHTLADMAKGRSRTVQGTTPGPRRGRRRTVVAGTRGGMALRG
ncbi:MAG TPA: Rrf2 family transcriptional regulator [Hyphomicrobiaceae bacterium]|nr:Rrf2 family transcriptional regulator [Hyphomicrobiaceae bacterium]